MSPEHVGGIPVEVLRAQVDRELAVLRPRLAGAKEAVRILQDGCAKVQKFSAPAMFTDLNLLAQGIEAGLLAQLTREQNNVAEAQEAIRQYEVQLERLKPQGSILSPHRASMPPMGRR